MFRPAIILTVGAIAAVSLSSPAAASPAGGALFIPAGDRADPPEGFEEMCHRDAVLCRAGVPDASVRTPAASPAAAPGLIATTDCARPAAGLALVNDQRPLAAFRATFVSALQFDDTAPFAADACDSAPGFAAASVIAAPVATISVMGTPVEDSSIPVVGAPQTWKFGTAALTLARASVRDRRPADGAPAYRPGQSASADMVMLRFVNRQVNRQVVQVSDLANNGVEEFWERPVPGRHPAGDCEDIAIEKRMRLIKAGFPPERLFYAVVYRANFGLHTILIARLDDGDYVLDSAAPNILAWSDVRYVWLRVQSTDDPMTWRRVSRPS